MRTETKTREVYTFDELTDRAKETARDWWRDREMRSGDNFFAEAVIEDATCYCEEASGSNGDYIDEGMDWGAFEAKILASIEEKRAELPEDHELFKPSTRNFFPSRDQKTFNFNSEC